MLDSMIRNPRPTRAEVGDVANAILDGTDAVMLSGESAKGKYPLETVKTMTAIADRTDRFKKYKDLLFDGDITITEAVSKGAVEAGNLLGAKAILVWTKSGRAARMVRKYGPVVPIVALTDNEQTARQLSLTRGVTSFVDKNLDKTDEFFARAMELVVTLPTIKKGDIVVLVTGISETGTTNTFKVGIVGE